MKSRERAKRVLKAMREGPIVELSPTRSEEIIAEAIREARAHGAGLVLGLLRRVAEFEDAPMHKLVLIIEDALRYDEEISSEPPFPQKPASG